MHLTFFFYSGSYLQRKHSQTVVILLGYRDYGDLNALVGHSVLRPVLCTFLQDTMDTQVDILPIPLSFNQCIYPLMYPSSSLSRMLSHWPRFSLPGWWSSLWLDFSPATPSSRSPLLCLQWGLGWQCMHGPHPHNPGHTPHTNMPVIVIYEQIMKKWGKRPFVHFYVLCIQFVVLLDVFFVPFWSFCVFFLSFLSLCAHFLSAFDYFSSLFSHFVCLFGHLVCFFP